MFVSDGSTLALLVEVPNAHSSGIYSVSFSPDGTKVISGSADKSIQLRGVWHCTHACCTAE